MEPLAADAMRTALHAMRTYSVCFEAGDALRANHERVLQDVTNPSTELNIDGKPLTQLELVRVPQSQTKFADCALKEICRRLLGEGFSTPRSTAEAAIWAQTADYLIGRTQGLPEDKPGRPTVPLLASISRQLQSLLPHT